MLPLSHRVNHDSRPPALEVDRAPRTSLKLAFVALTWWLSLQCKMPQEFLLSFLYSLGTEDQSLVEVSLTCHAFRCSREKLEHIQTCTLSSNYKTP